MRVTKQKDLSIAFVIDEAAIRRLDAIAAEVAGEPKNYSFMMYCSDDTRLAPENVAEIIDFPNTDRRRLTGISLATEYMKRPRIELRLDSTSGYRPLTYTIDAEDVDLPYIDEKLNGWIDTIRQWYSPFAFSSASTSFVSGMAWAVGFVMQIVSSISTKQTQLSTFWREILFYSGTFLVLAAWTTSYIRKWLFPVGIFAIGQGINRLANIRARQRNLSITGIVGFAIMLAVSILASVIGNRLTGK